MKTRTVLATAVAATIGGIGAADAATYTATLVSVASYSGNGSANGNISSSTSTWSYDDVTELLTQTGGQFNVRFMISGDSGATLFRHSIGGLVIGNGAAASGSSFLCKEGNFGSGVSASICGNYNFGANGTNNSSVTWGPGTTTARTIGGDDVSSGTQQSVAAYDGFATVSWVGTTLTLSNATCNPFAPGNANDCSTTGGFNTGYSWTLQAGPQTVIPIPATAWLLGTGVLGLVGRRLRQKRV